MPIITSDGEEFPNEYDWVRMNNFNQGKELLRQEYLNSVLDPKKDEQGSWYSVYNDQPTPHAKARQGNEYAYLKDTEREFEYKQQNFRAVPSAEDLIPYPAESPSTAVREAPPVENIADYKKGIPSSPLEGGPEVGPSAFARGRGGSTENKIVNQNTHFPSHHIYNPAGEYIGRIEKDQYGVWSLYDWKGRRTTMYDYKTAREEAKLLVKKNY